MNFVSHVSNLSRQCWNSKPLISLLIGANFTLVRGHHMVQQLCTRKKYVQGKNESRPY